MSCEVFAFEIVSMAEVSVGESSVSGVLGWAFF